MSLPVQIQVFRDGQMTGHVVLDGSRKVHKIGKTSSAQIKLDDPQASRVHAVIEVSPAGASLIDMGSAAGTLLNGERVNKARLNTGDEITIGSSRLLVTIGANVVADASLAATPVAGAMPGPMPGPISPAPFPAPAPATTPSSAPAGPPPSTLGPLSATTHGAAPAPTAMPASPAGPDPATLGESSPPPTYRDIDSSLFDTDPAVRRLKQSTRRHRLLGAGAVLGIIVAIGVFVTVARRGDVSEVEEPTHYSSFGTDPKGSPGSDAPESPEAGKPAQPATPGGTASSAAGTTPPVRAFDAGEARDEDTYAYEVLAATESFAAVAERRYGDATRADLIRNANPLAPADGSLPAGTEVRLPRFVVHLVMPGDTLGKIAKLHLGDAKLYERVFTANRDLLASPTAIDVGMKLKIPILTPATL
jgi:predicted component of type VI protein secretion system